jgi:long-chain acyl-CoA synthetase
VTLHDLSRNLTSFGSRPAVGLRQDLGVRWWSYERLHGEVLKAAALLSEFGIGKGDTILIQGLNCPEWVAFLLAATARGAVVVPLDHDASPEWGRRIAETVRAKLRITTAENQANKLDIPDLDLFSLHRQTPLVRDVLPHSPVSPADPAIILYTSGATSSPRGVVLTHGNLASQINRFRGWRFLARMIPARILVMAPLSHAQGIMLGVMIPLSLGMSVIFTHSSNSAHIIRVIRDNRVIFLSTVPRVLHLLSRTLGQQPYGKSNATLDDKLRGARFRFVRRHYIFTAMRAAVGYRFWIVIVGGAPLPEPDERFWWDSGCLLVQGYGLTETTGIISVNAPLFGAFRSVGKPLSHQEIRLAEDGEIMVRGPNVMPQYLKPDEAREELFTNGFLRTGDLGRLDKKNRLYIVGRKKEVIVTGEGFNVHSGDVEAALNGVDGVRDSVVFGIERDRHLQVHAVLLLNKNVAADAIVRLANSRLLTYQRIQSWTVWPENDFPRTSLLKPKRELILDQVTKTVPLRRAQSENGTADSIRDLARIEDKQKRLGAIAREIADGNPAESGVGDLSLAKDLGLSSLDTIELLSLVEKRSGTFLNHTVVEEGLTVGELHDLVHNPNRDRTPLPRFARDPPRWAEFSIVNGLRRLLLPPLLKLWTGTQARVSVSGREYLRNIKGPVILAGFGHEHAFDVFLLYYSLPKELRRKVAVVVSRWIFRWYFDPGPEITLSQRCIAALGFHVLAPLAFPFALSSHYGRARDGLLDACRLIDRGYSLILFQGRGMGVAAKQCGVPIVPVRLEGNRDLGFFTRGRFDVSVSFGSPLEAPPYLPLEQLYDSLKASSVSS